uniref:CAP-GLY domain containing linker protein 2 n=1 Tax=Neogobius melanostomus TaxID=47308 RepID=A0A8C6UIB4_9GOBI
HSLTHSLTHSPHSSLIGCVLKLNVLICPTAAPPKSNTPTKFSEEGDDVVGDYTVGESVWVNGVKAGTIAYLGETQFAPGQWAGVILNGLVGKNDGSVGGVRYFECQALQGIFTRPSKLSRQPAGEESDGHESVTGQPAHGNNGAPSGQRVVVPLREGLLNNAVKTGNESGSNVSDSGSVKKGGEKDLRVGDRVLVGGSKMGVIRYMGETDFAKGDWCGVELDEPLGKNDGAVAGTRYFQCLPKFGLFAPIHKVIRIGFPSTSPAKAKKSKRMAMGVSSLAHSPSSSSISSVSSVASSVGARPSRAGLLTETSSRYARKISGTTALQEALKEKQQHIEQLLAERDLERAEVAKANSRICEVEKELSALKASHLQFVADSERTLQQVQTLLAAAQKDKLELTNQLEEEKRKVEDLQFRVEEECIFKGDLEVLTHPLRVPLKLWLWRKESRLLILLSLYLDLVCLQQTTVEEQSRIKQLEKELYMKRAKIEKLEAKLQPSDRPSEAEDREQEASGEELDSLRSVVARQNQELSDLRQKVQQVNKENVDMMDSWKVRPGHSLQILQGGMGSLEELKVTLRSEPSGQESDQELTVSADSVRMEHQLEMENLKAKHKIEAAILSKEREDLSARLQEAQEQLENRFSTQTVDDHRGQSSEWTKDLTREAELKTQLDHRSAEFEALQQTQSQSLDTIQRLELELKEKQLTPDDTVRRLEEELRVTNNQLQALQTQNCFFDALIYKDMVFKIFILFVAETTEKLLKREKEVLALISQVEALKSQTTALEGKVHSGEKKVELLLQDKKRIEAELDSMSKKSHDASGQLVSISQELLKKERSLNELRVLLLESHRPSREERDVCKAEWKVQEQNLQDDIKSLREKLLLLGQERSSPDHRRYSMLEPSALDSEMTRLRQRLLSTEDALRNALEHNQSVDLLVQAMCKKPDRSQVHGAYSSNGIHHEQHKSKDVRIYIITLCSEI